MDKTKLTIQAYDSCSANFEKTFMDLKLYKDNLDEFSNLLPFRAKILDLGCGPGNITRLLMEKKRNFKMLGVDLSQEMINLATRNVPLASFLVGDIRNLSFLEKDFDAVIAAFCIVHLSNEEASNFIHDINCLLKSEGVIYLSCIQGSNSTYTKTSFSPNHEIFFNHFSEEFIVEALTDNGFTVLNCFNQDYSEPDGTIATEMFFYARKNL
jgi:ubiquinone/menaquinone biosynthesis C-methylase UbiE